MTTDNGTVESSISAATASTESANGVHPNPLLGNVRSANITDEMQGAYLDYAMSVIVARALPDVRDGLKPVHRRILYAMYSDLSLTHDKPHKKSARIVGEVLGKYHPHGDVAVYDAMVRMAQDFSLRYPLIDGQGNFGSIDGDSAAAMRYTEARLAEISDLILADLEKNTVNWHPNFDSTLREPDILPAALPNLLINGSSGIAVGMATNIPPHNLGEVVDALVYLIDNYAQVEEITVEQLMQFVKGPDFPTAGILYRYRDDGKGEETTDAIAQGYSVGKSRLVLQAKAHFEELSRGRMRIVVTELPYQTNKVALLERIAALVREEKIVGITDLRDESDRTGMRIVIELTRNVDPKDILKDLFKYTPLQQTFGMQLLALVDGQPRLLSLKRMLHLFIQHREEIVRRRSEFDLAKARDRAHIVEGLLRALDILDEVIHTIRHSQNAETARNNLVKNFKFTEIQAQAILDMQLRRLAALERRKLKDEYDELLKTIRYLEDLLAHPEKILSVIKEDLLAQKAKYADARRTQIVDRTKGTLTATDLLPDQTVWVAVAADGELRRQEISNVTSTILRQMGKLSQVALIEANTRDYLYLFSKDGRCCRIAIHEIPQDGAPKHFSELSSFTRRDSMVAALALPRLSASEAVGYIFLATEQGNVKRVLLSDFLTPITAEFVVMGIEEKDRLGWALQTPGNQELILVTAEGQSIRFQEDEVRSMGLPAGGVGGIKLAKLDKVVHAAVVEPDGALLTLTRDGFAKRTALTEYSRQGRNGSGIVTHKPTLRTGPVVAAVMLAPTLAPDETLVVFTKKGEVRLLPLPEAPIMGRSVQGKQVIEVKSGDSLLAVKRLISTKVDRAVEPGDAQTTTADQVSRSKPAAMPTTNGAPPEKATIKPDIKQAEKLVERVVERPVEKGSEKPASGTRGQATVKLEPVRAAKPMTETAASPPQVEAVVNKTAPPTTPIAPPTTNGAVSKERAQITPQPLNRPLIGADPGRNERKEEQTQWAEPEKPPMAKANNQPPVAHKDATAPLPDPTVRTKPSEPTNQRSPSKQQASAPAKRDVAPTKPTQSPKLSPMPAPQSSASKQSEKTQGTLSAPATITGVDGEPASDKQTKTAPPAPSTTAKQPTPQAKTLALFPDEVQMEAKPKANSKARKLDTVLSVPKGQPQQK